MLTPISSQIIHSRINALLNHTPCQWYYRLYRVFSSQRLQDFDQTHPCVFTLSTGRVGTQTLSALLNLAPNVFAYHEPNPSLFGLSQLAYYYSDQHLANQILQEAFKATRQGLFNYVLSCYKGYVETSPQATFLASIILSIIPEAKFIHLVRNPGDVVRSGMRRKWFVDHPNDNTRITPLPDTNAYAQWHTFSQFQKNLWLWNETNRWILDFSAKLPSQKFLLVQSEMLFNGDEETIKALFSFLETDMPPAKKIQKILGKKLNAQKVGAFPTPSEWTSDMRDNLLAMTGDTARKLGYKL